MTEAMTFSPLLDGKQPVKVKRDSERWADSIHVHPAMLMADDTYFIKCSDDGLTLEFNCINGKATYVHTEDCEVDEYRLFVGVYQ